MPAGKEPHKELSASLYKLLKECRVADAVFDVCVKKKLFDVIDLALLSPDIANVPALVLPHFKADVPGIGTVEIDGPIRKAWFYAERSVRTGKNIFSDEQVEESKALFLEGTWEEIHQNVLVPQHKVGEKLMALLIAIVSAIPARFPIIAIDKITIENEANSSSDSSLKIKGRDVRAENEDVLYTGSIEIIKKKMRALLSSFAYASINNRSWFKLQNADEAFMAIEQKIIESDQSYDAVIFFKKAYEKTMQAWQNSICVYKMTLAEAVKDRSTWLYYWSYQSVPGPVQKDPWPDAGKGKGKGQRSWKKALNETVFRAMQRNQPHQRPHKGGGKQSQQGKQKWGHDQGFVQQHPVYQKPYNPGKGGNKDGKGKGKGKGGKKNGGGKW